MNNFTLTSTESATLKDKWFWFETTDGKILEFVRYFGSDDTQQWLRSYYRMDGKILQVCLRRSNGEGFYRIFACEE